MGRILDLKQQESGSDYFGFQRVNGGWVCRVWAPDAREVLLAGDFNNWNWESHPLFNLENGCWVLFLPGKNALWKGCKAKLRIDGVIRSIGSSRSCDSRSGEFQENAPLRSLRHG